MAKLAECLGLDELKKYEDSDAAFRYRDEIYRTVAPVFRTRTTQEWLEYLRPQDFWCGPVQTYSQLAEDQQVHINEMVVEMPYKGSSLRLPGIPIKLSRTPGSIRRPPPTLGENTEEILSELGLKSEEILQLRKKSSDMRSPIDVGSRVGAGCDSGGDWRKSRSILIHTFSRLM